MTAIINVSCNGCGRPLVGFLPDRPDTIRSYGAYLLRRRSHGTLRVACGWCRTVADVDRAAPAPKEPDPREREEALAAGDTRPL